MKKFKIIISAVLIFVLTLPLIRCSKKTYEIKKSLNLKSDDFVVLMIAELNKNKNQIQLFKAMELLKDKYPNIKVLCAGDGGMMDELKGEIASMGLDNNVFMLGFRQDINDLINISDIGILMSYREGLPRNIMEFIACGRKVIATDIRGCRDLVCNDSVGSIVKVGDYEATAKEIEKYYLLGDKKFEISDEIKKYEIGTINNELKKIYSELNDEINLSRGVSFYASEK